MFQLSDLVRPIIVAPMAGGVSTPALVAAAADAGAMGFLAAGYTSVDALVGQIAATRGLGADLFGVNVFVPAPEPVDLAAARAYRDLLAGLAERYEVRLPEPRQDDDGWAAKIEALLDERVPVVSFAFGCPPAEVVRRFRGVGTATLATVTSALEAAQAAAAGVAGLVVQGPDGGGHRATFDALAEPGTTPLDEIVVGVRGVTGLPVSWRAASPAPRTLAPGSPGPRACSSAPPSSTPTRPAPHRPTGPHFTTRASPRRCSPGRSPDAGHAGCATPSSTRSRPPPRPPTRLSTR